MIVAHVVVMDVGAQRVILGVFSKALQAWAYIGAHEDKEHLHCFSFTVDELV